jgi:hypothetical protein
MPPTEVLILAVTKMLGGICIAGMTAEADPVAGLRWVRPTCEYGHVRLGDITTPDQQILEPFEVVEFNLLRPHSQPPHVEDWIADFVYQRPRIVRRLKGERRAAFLSRYLDKAPGEVLESQHRSLCLVRPEWVTGCFRLDGYSGHFEARLAFGVCGRTYRGSPSKGGVPVTDLRWRALGRAWLPEAGGWTEFETGDLEARFGIQELFLAVGLTRSYQGSFWPIVIGVHSCPPFETTVDYSNL